MAATASDPFIDCYRAWLRERAYSSGTAADFLQSFARTSGEAFMGVSCNLCRTLLEIACEPVTVCCGCGSQPSG